VSRRRGSRRARSCVPFPIPGTRNSVPYIAPDPFQASVLVGASVAVCTGGARHERSFMIEQLEDRRLMSASLEISIAPNTTVQSTTESHYTMISNIMKTKHETVKNTLNNVR
jgi:hypothetical protein